MSSLPPFSIVIPARYGSSRLPGKPLRPLCGRPMIQHVYERAMESGAAEVVVATDDPRIQEVVGGFGGQCQLTSESHVSGTDRVAEVARAMAWAPDRIVVNLQGDEPCMPPALIELAARTLGLDREAGIATLATPLGSVEEFLNPNVVKVVLDDLGHALYFSRAAIPWPRDIELEADRSRPLPPEVGALRHVGLYAYRNTVLQELTAAPAAALETTESLEQLRALARGVRIAVRVVQAPPGHGVDTEDDLARVEALLAKATGPQAG